MIQVRLQTFETNSSSTHSLVLVSPEEWESFKNDPDMLIDYYGEFIPRAAALNEYRENFCYTKEEEQAVTEDDLTDAGYYTYAQVVDGYAKTVQSPDGYTAISIYHCD